MSILSPNVNVETKLPVVPDATGLPPEIRKILDPVREILNVREGVNGDPLDANVTFRDLYNAGIVKVFLDSGTFVALPRQTARFQPSSGLGVLDYAAPPPLTSLAAFGAIDNIILTWDDPAYVSPVFSYAEIWRSGTNSLSTAVAIATTTASLYADPIGDTGATRYYWVRAVSEAGIAGAFNAVSGVSGVTGFVDTPNIAALAVTNAKIGLLAVDTANIANAAIVNAKIGALAVGTANIANAAITNAKIANLAVDSANINNLAVQTAHIADANVTTLKINGHAVTFPVYAYTAGSIGMGNGTVLQSCTITTSGGTVEIKASFASFNGSGATSSVGAAIYRGVTLIGQIAYTSVDTYSTAVSFVVVDAPAAGTYTYDIVNIGLVGSATLRSLSLVEFLR